MHLTSDQFPSPTSLPGRSVRVVLADDECMFRASLRQLLAVSPAVIKEVYGVDVGPGFQVVGEAGTGEETVRLVQSVKPDVLFLDLSMPRMSGLDALRELQLGRDGVRVILLAGTINKTQLLTAIELGARGLVLKDSTTELLFEAVVAVVSGRHWLGQTLITDLVETVRTLIQQSSSAPQKRAFGLTPRERQVLNLVAAGYANKEIALKFEVSEETVKHHLTRMFDKVGASNRLELAMLATERGLVGATSDQSL